MAVAPKSVRVGVTKALNTNLIYSRGVGLQASSRQVDIKEVLAHELAPIPTMFTDVGEMRCSTGKSVLKTRLKVEVSSRNFLNTDSNLYISEHAKQA